MEIVYNRGDLLESTADIIGHQTNCSGAFGGGVAGQIREKWPRVYEQYKLAYATSKAILGSVQIVKTNPNENNNRIVANLFGQEKFGNDGNKYTSYDGLDMSLRKLCKWMINNGATSVAFPYKLGCGLGGGEWDIVLAIIKSAFRDSNITIEIWALQAED